jgi:hypothetical protein
MPRVTGGTESMRLAKERSVLWRRHLAGDFADLRTVRELRRDAGATTQPATLLIASYGGQTYYY